MPTVADIEENARLEALRTEIDALRAHNDALKSGSPSVWDQDRDFLQRP